jgi:hypothetical protein
MPAATAPLVVTVSAPYGAAGSEIVPRLAEALSLPFLDRAIPTAVAERLSMPLAQAVAEDEQPPAALERLLRPFAALGPAIAGTPALPSMGEQSVAEATEHVIREQAESQGGVILGRAGALVLRDRPGTLHVRLAGPVERRIEQAMRVEGVDRETAQRRLEQVDRTRDAYVRYFYGMSGTEPSLYHLIIDSTAIAADACVAMIARAARSVAANA